MPDANFNEILNDFLKSYSFKVNIVIDDTKKAEAEANEYFKDPSKNIWSMNPLAVYYILIKLSESEQIAFFKNNFDYIKEHNEEIFIYDMISPEPLATYLSLNVLKFLKETNSELTSKIISRNICALLHSYNQNEYLEFFSLFKEDIIAIRNMDFINACATHSRFTYDLLKTDVKSIDFNYIHKTQDKYNKEFIDFILENYIAKIRGFNAEELLKFMHYLDDAESYENFLVQNVDIIKKAVLSASDQLLCEFFKEADDNQQNIMVNYFGDIIFNNFDKAIVKCIIPQILVSQYKKYKDFFESMNLIDWLEVSVANFYYNEEFTKILDDYEISSLEEILKYKIYNTGFKTDYRAFKYLEEKYRKSIQDQGLPESVTTDAYVFADKYLANLKKIRRQIKNGTMTRTDNIYTNHLNVFIAFLKKTGAIQEADVANEIYFKEIERLFYRTIMGASLSWGMIAKSINDIALINRIGDVEYKTSDFTVSQIEEYNVKYHKKLCSSKALEYHGDNFVLIDNQPKNLILKLFLMVGYNNAKRMLEIDDSTTTLEHLVGNVDVKNIRIDNQGNPILNERIMAYLFPDKTYSKISDMLANKDGDLYKLFPRIFNEWNIIDIYNKDRSLKVILDFLKNEEVSLSPKYYRLKGLFKFIGRSNYIVNDTFAIHDEMLSRVYSTIPQIKGQKGEYTYEVLDLHSMEGLTVGNITNCCFTVRGVSYSSLKHALLNKNGRILVVKKDGVLVAHSWLWRNGDLLCLDSIELPPKAENVPILDVYLQFADELIQKSYAYEGVNCIKNITIGGCAHINGLDQLPVIRNSANICSPDVGHTSLPQPIEPKIYSDAKNIQHILRGSGDFHFGQTEYLYEDDRAQIMHYAESEDYSKEYMHLIYDKLNSLRYIKCEQEQIEFSLLEDIEEAYCNEDWYYIRFKDGSEEEYIFSSDARASEEMTSLKNDFVSRKLSLV